MRAAPAIQVTQRSFGAWRLAVATLAATAAIALLAWFLSRNEVRGPADLPVATLAAVAVATSARSLRRCAAWRLRWDGACWWLGDAAASGPAPGAPDPVAGHVAVALDLGGWMLLRFSPHEVCHGRRGAFHGTRWLPAQRQGLTGDWHGLRCTVHARVPRAPGGTPPAGEAGRTG